MAVRSLEDIKNSLRRKLAEADPLDYMGDLGVRSPHRGDPIMSPDLGGGQGPGGAGSGGPKVWRLPGQKTTQTSPRIDKAIAANKGREKELGPVKDPVDATARIMAQQRAAAGRPPREPSTDKPSVAPAPQTPAEKLIAQAQQQAKQSGEPTVAITEPRVARVLDRLFPEPKPKVEPRLQPTPASIEAQRREKLQQLRQREAERQQQNQPAPAQTNAPQQPAEKPISKKDQKNLDRYGTTDQEKIANIRKLDAERRKAEKETPLLGPGGRAALKIGVPTAAVAGGYELLKDPDKPEQDTKVKSTVDQPAADKPSAPPARNSSPAGANSKKQSELPQDDTVTEPQAVEPVITPAPNKPYPPGTKFSPDEILETYSRVLNKYKNFLYEETAEERKQAETLKAIQRSIYGMESGYGKARTDKPNYAGARGPMQIKPGTFQWMKDKNIIPKDFDIKNPEQNKQAGNALIGHYFQKYQGDPAKVYAAYYAGPGAIRKDGSINTHWRDRKNPKAPTVGNYIDSGLAKAGLSDVKYVAAKPSTTTTAAVPTAPVKPSTDATTTIAKTDTAPKPEQTKSDIVIDKPTEPTNVAAKQHEFKDVFDYDAFHKAAQAGQDLSNISKFMKSAKTTADLSERYMRYKITDTR